MHSRIIKFSGLAITLWLLAALLIACQPVQPEPASAQAAGLSEEEQFVEVVMAAEEAFQANDAERTLSFYAENAVSLPPGFPASVGKEAITADYKGFFDAYSLTRDFELVDVDVSEDYATRTGEWTQVLTPKDGGDPITEVGRCILGWEKIDGDWKVVWEIWNLYDEQPAS